MVKWPKKLTTAISRNAIRSRLLTQSLLPKSPFARRVGHALVIPGLTAMASLGTISPLVSILDDQDQVDEIDFDHAKVALRVLAGLGDGIIAVPCLKGIAGIALEIIGTLETVQSNRSKCRELALRICQILSILHEGTGTGGERNVKGIVEFQRNLYRILRTIKSISRSSWYVRILKANEVRQKLASCDTLLDHSRDMFFNADQVQVSPSNQK